MIASLSIQSREILKEGDEGLLAQNGPVKWITRLFREHKVSPSLTWQVLSVFLLPIHRRITLLLRNPAYRCPNMSSTTQTDSIDGSPATSTAIMNGASPNEKMPSSRSIQASASRAFSKLIDAVKECSKYESAYHDIEGTQDSLDKMKLELKRTREELRKEKDGHNHLVTRQAEELKKWGVEKQVLETDKVKWMDTLQEERKKTEEALKEERKKTGEIVTENEELNRKLEEEKKNIAALEQGWEDEKGNASRLKIELARMKRVNGDLDSELVMCKEELREWKSYGAVLHDVDVVDL
jgi:chromosome segregation ATPase